MWLLWSHYYGDTAEVPMVVSSYSWYQVTLSCWFPCAARKLLFLLMRVRKLIKANGILIRIIADTSVLSGVNLSFYTLNVFNPDGRIHPVRAKERLFVFLSLGLVQQ